MQNCWNGKGKNKENEWKTMVVERGKTCSRSKEKSNFNRELESEHCISIFIDNMWKVIVEGLKIP
jgi:hypothetical protein